MGNKMKNFTAFFVVLMLVSLSCNQGNKQQDSTLVLKTKRTLSNENRDFLFFIVPKIKKANAEINETRQKIIQIRQKYDTSGFVSSRNRKWLNKIADSFALNDLLFDKSVSSDTLKMNIGTLLKRADIVPLKLVTAQACVESEWGRSRFAKEANNYFGVHCYMKGCGLAPKGVENPSFEVKAYDSPQDAIEDYLWIINTGRTYKDLRAKRAGIRAKGKTPKALSLTDGLLNYSEKGEEYVNLLNGIITQTLPENLSDIN